MFLVCGGGGGALFTGGGGYKEWGARERERERKREGDRDMNPMQQCNQGNQCNK